MATNYFEKPIRFLAIAWQEPWEFDHPTVLLEPIFCYSPNGDSVEDMIDNVSSDISLSIEYSKPIVSEMQDADKKEFAWRGWSLERIREVAEAKLRGEKVKLGTRHVEVLEIFMQLRRKENGEVCFE